MGKWRRSPQPPDYEVGYGRPPKSTRFQPGQSGNPRGRPRQQKSIGALLQKAASRKIRIQENGVTKYLPAEEVALMQLANKAAKNDSRATKLFFDLTDLCPSEWSPLIIPYLPGDDKL